MLRGPAATAAAETDTEFAWGADAGSVAGRWGLLQPERGVHQLPRALLLAAAALSPASLRRAGIGYAAHRANGDDRLHSAATAAAAERDRDLAAARYARAAVPAPSAAAPSSAAASRGPDDAAAPGRYGAVRGLNVELQVRRLDVVHQRGIAPGSNHVHVEKQPDAPGGARYE